MTWLSDGLTVPGSTTPNLLSLYPRHFVNTTLLNVGQRKRLLAPRLVCAHLHVTLHNDIILLTLKCFYSHNNFSTLQQCLQENSDIRHK